MKYELESALLLSVIVAGVAACASREATRSETSPPSQGIHSEAESEGSPPSHGAHSEAEHSEASGVESPAAAAAPAAPNVAPVQDSNPVEEARASVHSKAVREESTAYDRARPAFETYCAKCHTSQGSKVSKNALDHFSMDAYPFGGHHADEISATIRHVLGVTGSPPTMPRDRPGSVKGEELQLILAWAKARDPAATPPPASGGHDHTKHEH